jgi:hypothetical protein
MTNTVALKTESAFTKRQIIAFFSGFKVGSKNAKTGPMIQVHLLDPAADLRRGPTVSMCGTCPRRPGAPDAESRRILEGIRPCYVTWSRAPRTILEAYDDGRIPEIDWISLLKMLRTKGSPCRLGASGDPCHLGCGRIAQISATVPVTGYTRAWRMPRFQELAGLLMASADTMDDASRARTMGWRVFRARREHETLMGAEWICPASAEAGHKVQCIDCLACGPRGSGNVAIVEH